MITFADQVNVKASFHIFSLILYWFDVLEESFVPKNHQKYKYSEMCINAKANNNSCNNNELLKCIKCTLAYVPLCKKNISYNGNFKNNDIFNRMSFLVFGWDWSYIHLVKIQNSKISMMLLLVNWYMTQMKHMIDIVIIL